MNGNLSNSFSAGGGAHGQAWRKVLYEKQGVADNYVDSSFLTEMKKNLFVRRYDYWALVINTGCITQQMNAVVTFVMCFIYLQLSVIDHQILNEVSAAILILTYFFSKFTSTYSYDLKALVTFCTASFVLSPVLMSLTETISTDTIYAMTSAMLLVHLISHDYQLSLSSQGVVSFNAGIFATVCLASRLPTIAQGYALTVLAVLIFAMFPNLRHYIRTHTRHADLFLTLTCFLLAVGMVSALTFTFAILLTAVFLFITFVCPYLLVSLQPLKNNVYGPWDEAVVAES